MRRTALILLSATLAGCGTVPPAEPSARAEAELREALAGRVAGPAVECLPSDTAGSEPIGDTALLFRDGNRLWLSRVESGNCSALEGYNYTMVTRTIASSGLCSGDLVRVVDLKTDVTAGACVLGDFVPYTRP